MATLTSQRVTAGGRNNDVLFHRRLDRTPESVDKFRRLSPENKEKIHDLRAAVAGACLKMSLLEDDVEEKQAAIEHEHALRLAAEARLEEGLVDMYGDPAVTQELRQRLPRAVSDGRRRTQSLSPRFRGHRVPASQMTVGDNLQRNKEDVSAHHQGDVRRSLDFSEGSRRRTRKDRRRHRKSGSSSGEDDVSDGVSDPSEHVSRVRGKQDPSLPGRPPEAPVNTAPQILHPPTNVSPAAFVSPYLTMVVAQPVTCIPQTIPQAPPIVHSVSAPTLPHASQSPPLGGRLSAPIPSTDPLTLGSASAKQVSYLLEELRLARESNKQLTEKLTSCEQELVSTKHALHTKEVENDLSITGQVAAVIEEIEQQHQEREASVLGRLRLANQERDSMYSRLKHYGAIPDDEEETREDLEEDDISSDEFLELDVEQLLSQVNTQSSLGRISRTADHVTALIQATQRRREEVIAEEMGVVLEERDVALAKCQRLEKQLIQCERKANPYNLHPSPERALQTQLAKAHQALNESQCKVQDLEEELQTLRIYHSVRKDVLTETELNNTVDLYEVQLHQKDSRMSSVQKENNILLAQLRGTAEELEKTRASLRETTKHNQQLERLVKVLKRKINTPDGQHGVGL